MKSLKKTKLTQLSKAEMEEKQMNATRGGLEAGCMNCVCLGGPCTCDYTGGGNYLQEEQILSVNDFFLQGWYDSNTTALIEHQIVASQNGWDCYT